MSTELAQTTAAPITLQAEDLTSDLLAALDQVRDSLRSLLELAEEKLAAIRSADTVRLKQVAERECEELQILFDNEQHRDAALARLAQSLHFEPEGPPRLSELADRLQEPISSRLRAKIEGLRSAADALRQKNRVAAGVARSLHKHIRGVFEDVARVNRETIGYGPDGQYEQHRTDSWVDAIG